jgi:hypothetical protein
MSVLTSGKGRAATCPVWHSAAKAPVLFKPSFASDAPKGQEIIMNEPIKGTINKVKGLIIFMIIIFFYIDAYATNLFHFAFTYIL